MMEKMSGITVLSCLCHGHKDHLGVFQMTLDSQITSRNIKIYFSVEYIKLRMGEGVKETIK